MAQYKVGELVHHLFKVRINGTAATSVQVTSLVGKVFIDGVESVSTTVVITSVGAGIWRAQYTVPSGLADGVDLSLIVDMLVEGIGKSVSWHDQVMTPASPSELRDYLQANPIDVGLTTSAIADLVTQISTGGVAADEIAKQVLLVGVSDALETGAMDRHSMGAMVLIATNADTTSNPGAITARHPDTDAALFQYIVSTGPGCPIQSVT